MSPLVPSVFEAHVDFFTGWPQQGRWGTASTANGTTPASSDSGASQGNTGASEGNVA